MIGTPQNTSAQAKGDARRSPRSETAPSAPTRPPAPRAAVRYPTSDAPASSTWYAVTTINTFKHPRTNVCEAMRPTRSRAQGASAIALKPCQTSTPAPPTRAGTRPGTDTRARRAADARRATAPAAKTVPTSANTTSTPAPSGPSRVARLSIVDVAPFAAISSFAVRASDGSRAARAGRNSVEQTPTAAAAAKTTIGSSSTAPTAETTRAAAPRSTTPSRNRSRRKRSPRDAANGAITAAGSRRTTPAMPTAVVPPWSYANTPRATKCAHSADTEAPQANSARRTSTFRAATRRAANTWRRRVTITVNPTPHRDATPGLRARNVLAALLRRRIRPFASRSPRGARACVTSGAPLRRSPAG